MHTVSSNTQLYPSTHVLGRQARLVDHCPDESGMGRGRFFPSTGVHDAVLVQAGTMARLMLFRKTNLVAGTAGRHARLRV